LGRAGRDIPAIGRWKLLDNLRRSLVAPACLGLLVASWSVPHAPWAAWLVVTILTLSLPAILSVFDGLLPPRWGVSLRHHIRMVLHDVRAACVYVLVSLTFLAQQTWLVLDAVVRTLWRLFVSRRNLLEWVTAAQVQSTTGLSLENFLWALRSAGVAAFGATASVLYFNPIAVPIAAPFVLLWWASPLIARAISLPPQQSATKPLGSAQAVQLRLIARRTWRFFAAFVTATENWLPPDNFQEDPQPVVAHRSSPTNIGLYLLSTVAARDFGWLGLKDMIDRLEATLKSMHALPRHRGHFLNWYDTRALQPLTPQYISSVDSGNLAGHLIALEQACRSLIEKPLYDASSLRGIADAVLLLRHAIATTSDLRRTLTVDVAQLHAALDEVESLLAAQPATASHWDSLWSDLEIASGTLLDIAQTFADERAEAAESEVLAWASALHADVMSQRKEVRLLPPSLKADTTNERPDTTRVPAHEAISAAQSTPVPALGDIPAECARRIAAIDATAAVSENTAVAGKRVADQVAELQRCAQESTALIERLTGIALQARQLFDDMDFMFLFDPHRKLFSIGYRVADAVLDESYYDLLASEARLASFIAIAKGEVPVAHWFRLGRPMVPIKVGGALISWSGSMFEYLMPSLMMRTPSQTLLEGTCRLVVERQIEYGFERAVPWGISESAYSQRDRWLTYQYAAFGVPGLGFKRGLGQDLVIAPYATALAAMYDAPAAAANFGRLELAGGRGAYGFYEALDFTPARLPENSRVAIVRAYMAHHQGMSLLALANVLLDGIMRRRFHRHPMVQAAELLLEERTPREIVEARIPSQETSPATVIQLAPAPARQFRTARLPSPATHLLSNGRYTVMITAAGSGYSSWENLAITRWREDPTCDAWGSYLFLRDTATGEIWSAGTQPAGKEPDRYEVVFSEDRARIHRTDGSISTLLEVIVSPEDDAEIRRLSITNHGLRARQLEITSYQEIVLAPPAADLAHPVFSNLFVQTEFAADVRGVLATRRPRKGSDPANWVAHVLAVSSEAHRVVEYETDRARFLGRGRSVRKPLSVMDGRPLSNTVGAVLDPILSLRTRVSVPPGAIIHLAFATMAASTREQIISLADKYHDPASFGRISMLAWTHALVQRYHLGVGADEANLFQYLANALLYFDATLRAGGETIRRATGSVRQLWRHGISGDYPIVLCRIDDADDREIVRQLLRAHEYWRSKCLAVDVVFLNEKGASYSQDLQALLENMVQGSQPARPLDGPPRRGSLFVLNAAHLPAEELDLLHRAARVILVSKHGSLAEQVARAWKSRATPAPPPPRTSWPDAETAGLQTPKLDFFNGLGGFTEDGREYVTLLRERHSTPAPWVNVIANEQFGFLVSESGSSTTWCLNSRENQITPWSNDPVSDWPGEALYIRDDDSGRIWSPTALPIRIEGATYIARHGQGFSRFEHQSHGIHSELLQFVGADDPVKVSVLTLENRSSHIRELSVTTYVEWVLGTSRTASAPYIVTEIDADTGALFARNPWNAEFGNRVAFLDMAGRQTRWTGDRREFIGRNGTLERPLALTVDTPLSGRIGGDLDPCGALSTALRLAPGDRSEVVFYLGQSADRPSARALIERYRRLDPETALAQVRAAWERTLGAIQVQTPERALDFMLNRWLVYQTLSCRIWARAGFYQPGGAYGFRDQLQDCMALMVARPQLAREHLLRAAGRQFLEGDVQHWWHPPSGRGVRTHCSDDRVWLSYAVAHYVEVTQDTQILDERLPFLEGQPLAAEQEDAYFEPVESARDGSLYEHCVRALERSLANGPHGLPLIGSGDWNDGMNRVGHAGKGESVWLGWFLHATLERFAALAIERGEIQRAGGWREHAANVKAAIEKEGWDGAWYRRAYFDDGTPLGSASSSECRIDSVAQSWSVISGAGEPQRARHAMRSVEEYLIRAGDDLVLLLTPPFDKTPLDPGYIKGYPSGIRENGGQYTHAAVWCAIAYAMQGEGDSAGELLRMLNPINRTASRAGVHAYKVEPYVVAADIYSVPPHARRGGWTWYTGSAGWMHRAGVEWMLGIRKRGNTLSIDPCIPREWPGFQVRYRHGTTPYKIDVSNPRNVMRGVVQIVLDGEPLEPVRSIVPLVDDGRTHDVRVVLG
jgi:cyclic beta-1,2-glucan synthetase